MNIYAIIILVSLIIVLSFLFNSLSKKTSFPSVLLLILLGIGVNYLMQWLDFQADLIPMLEVLGIIGLIMIVLEAALDLELKREKKKLIASSMIIAFLGLILSSLAIAFIIKQLVPNIDFLTGLIYAIPLAIMSSAIVIPSVVNLEQNKKEFMVYESTFSDIFGIMFFFYVIENVNASDFQEIAINVSTSLVSTVVVSVILGYLLVWGLQAIKSGTKFFLILALLILLYSIGKLLHVSSLLIILIFGLILNNRKLFFKKRLGKLIKNNNIERLLDDFKMFTAETAFLVRTFFFVFFGMSLSLDSLTGSRVWVLGFLILVALFLIRFILFKIIRPKNIFPELLIAPRGLISILLFFAIPEEFEILNFESGVLFFIIFVTAIIMAYSLMVKSKTKDGVNTGEIPEGSEE